MWSTRRAEASHAGYPEPGWESRFYKIRVRAAGKRSRNGASDGGDYDWLGQSDSQESNAKDESVNLEC